MMKKIQRITFVFLFLMVVVLPVLAVPASAAEPATVIGTVKDASGSPISSVKVTLSISGVTKDTDYTDSNGLYDVTCSVSAYTKVTLKYEKSGYNTYTTTAYVSPGALTLKNIVMSTATTQGVKGTVTNQNGNMVSGVKVNLYIGSTLKSTVYTNANGYYSIYCAVTSSTTVTLKFYDHGYLVATTTATVNPGSYTTKNVQVPNQYDVTNRIVGEKEYAKFVAAPSTYAEFGLNVENLRLSYHTCPSIDDVTFVDFSLTVSTNWNTLWYYAHTLEVVLESCPNSFVFLGKYRSMGDYWYPDDEFTITGSIPYTYGSWTDPYFTIKFAVGAPALSETLYMEMKFRIDSSMSHWTEYYDKCFRTYGAVTEEIYPSVTVDSWSFPLSTTVSY